jgi:hypothetical protein
VFIHGSARPPWNAGQSRFLVSHLNEPEQKLEQLKQIADDVDAKITPLLDQQQQQKFQQIREEHRRELIEKMAEQVIQKAESSIGQRLSD